MNNQKAYGYIGAAILALAVIGGIVYMVRHAAAPAPVSSGSVASTSDSSALSSTTIKGKGYTITSVPISNKAVKQPSLDRQPVFAASIPADVRTILSGKIAATSARLKKDPSRAADWYDLAIYFHEADDSEGARLIWEFLTKAAPQSSIAFLNLGKLYQFDLHDYPKSEAYFKQAISVDPKNLEGYLDLYQLYLYSYKQNSTLAVDTLNGAALKFSTSTVPYETLGTYYRDKNDIANARAALEKALARAEANHDVAAMKHIGEEISALPLQQTRTQ